MNDLAAPLVASEPAYLELTFSRAMCIWWAYFWRHILYGGPVALVVRFLEELAGLGGRRLLLSLSTVLALATVSMFVLGIVLHKQFRHFSIRLVASPR